MTNIAHELCGPFGCLCRVHGLLLLYPPGTRLMVTGPGPGRNPRDPRPRGRPGTPRGPPGACRPQRFGGPEGKVCLCDNIRTPVRGATLCYAHNHYHPGPKSQVNTKDAHEMSIVPRPHRAPWRLLWGCGSRMPLAGHRVAAVRNRFPYHSSLASLSSSLSSSSLTFIARQA